MTRFSIIVPFHNDAATIAATLNSLLGQSFADFELICVGDKPSRQTTEVVRQFCARDARVRVEANPNRGPSSARNHGAAVASGDILAFCDADDLWVADKLAQLDRVFAETGIDATFGQIGFFSETPGDCPTRSTVPTDALTIPDLLAENAVCTMSNLAVRRQVFAAVGGLNPAAVHNEDLELLIRLAGEGHVIIGVDRLQVWYRTSGSGLSSNLEAMRAGRARAVATAARYGVAPSPASEAIYMRYLARRALRLGAEPSMARAYARAGLALSARSFLNPIRRGVPTALGAALAPALPRPIRQALFAR